MPLVALGLQDSVIYNESNESVTVFVNHSTSELLENALLKNKISYIVTEMNNGVSFTVPYDVYHSRIN